MFTKKGDRGKTSTINEKNIWKFEDQVEIIGSLDELSAFVGLVIGKIKRKKEKEILILITKNLYQIMAVVAGENKDLTSLEKVIKFFEQYIKEEAKNLSKLKKFILPIGDEVFGWLNILRTICRKTERKMVFCLKNIKINSKNKLIIIKYLNRLSSLFFVMSRKLNTKKEITV